MKVQRSRFHGLFFISLFSLFSCTQLIVLKPLDEREPPTDQFRQDFLFLKAYDASLNGRSDEAIILFEQLLSLSSKSDVLKRRYAIELVHVERFEESLKYLKPLFENSLYKKDKLLGIILAAVYSTLKDRESAVKIYKKILADSPGHIYACILLANLFANEKKWKKADHLLLECSRRDLDNGIFDYTRGEILLLGGAEKRAIAFFKNSLLKKRPYALAHLQLAQLYDEAHREEEAIQHYKFYLQNSDDGNKIVVLNRLVALLFKFEKYSASIPYMEKILGIDPRNMNVQFQLGVLYLEDKKYTLAKDLFTKILKIFPTSEKIHFYQGVAYYELNDLKHSLEHFGQIFSESPYFLNGQIKIAYIREILIRRSPDHMKSALEEKFFDFIKISIEREELLEHPLLFLKSIYFERMGNLKKSLAVMENIERKTSESYLRIAEVLKLMALRGVEEDKVRVEKKFFNFIAEISLKKRDLRFSLYEIKVDYLQVEKRNEEALTALLSIQDKKEFLEIHGHHLASLFEKNNDFKNSQKTMENLLVTDPNNAQALNFLGYSLLKRKDDLPEAYRYIQRAIEIDPDNPYIRDSLGWYYYRIGDLKRALEEILTAYEDISKDIVVMKHLAIIYRGLKDFRNSDFYLSKAIKHCKTEEEKQKLRSEVYGVQEQRMPLSLKLTKE